MDLTTYKDLFRTMMNFMKIPNLIIHLDVKPEIAYKRLKDRSRDYESGVSLNYLTGETDHAFVFDTHRKDIANEVTERLRKLPDIKGFSAWSSHKYTTTTKNNNPLVTIKVRQTTLAFY